jgi:hypothetical protein
MKLNKPITTIDDNKLYYQFNRNVTVKIHSSLWGLVNQKTVDLHFQQVNSNIYNRISIILENETKIYPN